jgi:cell wall-associated NlpC family hydrolase
LCGFAGFAVAAPAGANPPGPHDPVGHVGKSVKAVAGGILVHGWAADPDALASNVHIKAVLDGHTIVARGVTDEPDPAITKQHDTGPTPAFQLTVPVSDGQHTVCIVAVDQGAGVNNVLKCVATPLGRTVSSTELAAHSPVGALTHAHATARQVHVKGWATDPDYVARRTTAVLYIDNSAAATVITTVTPAPRPDGAGRASAFDITAPVTPGAHMACVWAVNVGFGDNTFLGCDAVDTRGGPGSDPVHSTTATQKIVKVAKNHIGDRYVWGATGPKTFDCSGLVVFSYGKAGLTPPRVSEDQFGAARVIPASRAVPGDLVFWHDSEGDVYHVGIYLAPGRTVAAIDPAEGVDYQTLWDPSLVTYGSFTHD